jgi:Capsule assembly protein Wzi
MDLRSTIHKCFFLTLILPVFTFAQVNFEAGSEEESILRDFQLLQLIPSTYSFTVRPIIYPLGDSSIWDKGYFVPVRYFKNIFKSKIFSLKALPISSKSKFNTHSSWGRNDGGFLYTKRYQQILCTGLELNSKIFDLRIAPDVFYTADNNFQKKFNLHGGQSIVRLKAGNILGLTAGTQQFWWGPAVFNSLMMSNNAPGFPHVTFHTLKPLSLPIGIIEFQLVGGHLKNKSNWPMENFGSLSIDQVLPNNVATKRYFSGFNFAFQPVFMHGFTIGINRMFQYYLNDQSRQGNFIQTYIPVLTSVFKNKAGGNNGLDEDARNRDQLLNIFARYLFKEYHLEVYGEFGWNDHKYNMRDLASNPDHAAAYNIGLRKVIPIKPKLFYTLDAEVTQMAPTNSDIARGSGNWYVHSGVREGYTHFGQIIGGGVAPGDNTATFRMSRTTDKYKQSFLIERYQHDPQFHTVKWTDWCIGFRHMQHLNSFTVAAGLDVVPRKNFNYQPGTAINFQPSLKLIYNWR